MRRPSLPSLVLLLSTLLPCADARAEDQPLTYRILSQDRPIGSRETAVTYVAGPLGEVRMLRAWTTLVLPLPREALQIKQRIGARLGGDRSFSVSSSTNGEVREVQGRQEPDGSWSLTLADAEGARTWNLAAEAVDLCSPELLDPERALRTLRGLTRLKLLSVETGTVLEGPVEALGPMSVPVGDQEVSVERFRFSPPEGGMTLAFHADGWLVAYDYQILGQRLGARLERMPPPRNFDTAIEGPITGAAVGEESL